MNRVPKIRFKEFSGEWEEKMLRMVGEIITGSTPETKNKEYYNGEYLFVSPFDISSKRYVNNTKTKLTRLGFEKGRRVRKDSVLFVCIGSTIGKIAQAGKDCITNQQINSIQSREEYSDDFIYSLLEFNSNKIKLMAGEQAVPLINKTDFSNIILNFPSIKEQEKIADFLSSVDKKIEKLERKKELWEEYKKGMMQKIFSQEIRFKDESGNEYPQREEERLGDCFENKGGTALEKYVSENEKYKFISIGNYSKSRKYYDNGQRIILNEKTKEKLLNKGDLVMVLNDKTSSGDIIGTCILIDEDEKYIYNQRSERLIPKKRVNFVFAWFYLNSDYVRGEIVKIAQGGTQIYVNYGNVAKLKLQLPSLPEQEKIANFLSSIDFKIEIVEKELEGMKEFKKGLLQGMFV